MVKIGIIGGTGFSALDILDNPVKKHVETPFGNCSDCLITGTYAGVECVFLARHAKGHALSPTLVNYRANVWALKQVGCTHLIATSAVGSLKENIHPGDIVLLDQFIDRTYKRTQTFYDNTEGGPSGVCHIPMHTPFCPVLRDVLSACLDETDIAYHKCGTVVTVEGPRFSSKAESHMFRLWGADVINMTIIPEVVLAKEVGLSYATLALVTDYDCWREGSDHVDVGMVLETMRSNADKAKRVILSAIPRIKKINWDSVIEQNNATATSSVMQ